MLLHQPPTFLRPHQKIIFFFTEKVLLGQRSLRPSLLNLKIWCWIFLSPHTREGLPARSPNEKKETLLMASRVALFSLLGDDKLVKKWSNSIHFSKALHICIVKLSSIIHLQRLWHPKSVDHILPDEIDYIISCYIWVCFGFHRVGEVIFRKKDKTFSPFCSR